MNEKNISYNFITDRAGFVYEFFLNLPFGETMSEQHSQTADYVNKWKFTGHELDRETGLYYAKARYYDPKMSLFLSVDPLLETQPNKTPYHYASNNPVNRVDPDGLWDDWVERADGTIYWDEKATSPETTKEGERYLGEKLGSDETLLGKDAKSAKVTIYGSNGKYDIKTYDGLTVSSDPKSYSMIEEGEYEGRYQQMATSPYGKGSFTYRIHNLDGTTKIKPKGGTNKVNNKSFMEGIFLHRTNWSGKATSSSQGCLNIDGRQWKDVEKQLGKTPSFKIILNRN